LGDNLKAKTRMQVSKCFALNLKGLCDRVEGFQQMWGKCRSDEGAMLESEKK
jgi:hypothetical protein